MNRRSAIKAICAVGALAAIPSIANALPDSSHVTMVNGSSHIIQYTHWSGQLWTASLDTVKIRPNGADDPTFIHVNAQGKRHNDEFIEYIAWDNQRWRSKCHTHTSALFNDVIKFTFEHFKGSSGKPDHEDGTLGFTSWDGGQWLASVPDLNFPKFGGNAQPTFSLHKRNT
jgi:hypothetical protein